MNRPLSTASQRVDWIDACKGLGIIFVVFGHNSVLVSGMPLLYQAVFLFHVPLFFFVTGLTSRPQASFAVLWRRVAGLLVPYLLLSWVMLPVFLHDTTQGGVSIADFAAGLLYGSGFTIYDVPLWFLPCLAVALVLAWVLDVVVARSGTASRARTAVLTACAVLLLSGGGWLAGQLHGALVQRIGWGSPLHAGWFWSADLAPVAAGFVLVGQLLRKRVAGIAAHAGLLLAIALAVMLLLALAVCQGVRTDLNLRQYDPWWQSTLAAFTGIAGAVAFSMLAVRVAVLKTPLLWAGQSSLIILWLHGLVQHKSVQLISHGLSGVPLLLASGAVAVAVPVLVDRLVVRRFAWSRALIYPRFNPPSPGRRSAVSR